MEFTCRATQDRTYPIILEWNAVDRIAEIFQNHKISGSYFVISDKGVFPKHGKRLLKALRSDEIHTFLITPGEASKSLQNWNRIQNFFLQHGADRRSIVIAFGGGVVGDLAGFAASTYMRGLDFIQI